MALFLFEIGMRKLPCRLFPDKVPMGPMKIQWVTFAMTTAPNSRTTQFFINYGDNSRLAKFVPFGKIVKGMRNVDAINSRYGQTPSQQDIAAKGNVYLKKRFPKLDYIKLATIVKEPEDAKKKPAPRKKEGKK